MTRYAIALGSNLGDRIEHLRAAIGELGRLGEVDGISGLYETAPIGGPDQGPYLNAVVSLESTRSPPEVLEQLQGIESNHGRERAIQWGPRTLDLDIVVMEPGSVSDPGLIVPHPRAAERRFVLEPLCDVWPEATVAEGVTAAAARRGLEDQEVDLLARDWVEGLTDQGSYWVAAQFALFFVIGFLSIRYGSLPGSGSSIWRIVGGLLLAAAVAVAVASARSLGRALTALPEPVSGAELIETGPYAHARHPIYGAIIVGMVGASLLFASAPAVLACAVLTCVLWGKSGYEERRLRITYPGYSGYRRRVRHRLLPFII